MHKVGVIEFILTLGDGGAETLVKDYALLMDKDRFDVTVVVLHEEGESANLKRLRDGGVNIIVLSSEKSILKKIWRKLFWKKDRMAVQSEDVQEKPVLPGDTYEKPGFLRICRNNVRNLFFGIRFLRVLHQTGATVVHGHLDVLRCLQMISPFLKGIRLLHTCHALPELIYEGEEGIAVRHLIRHNGLQLIALHDDMAAQMNEMFPEQKTVVIRNGINMGHFRSPGVTKEAKQRALGIPANAYVVGHVGRFTPEKNHTFLVDVFREISDKRENAYLLMVGAEDPGCVVDKLNRYGLQNRYQILSHRTDVHELMAAMDVFVFPSIFEGFGISAIEAQAAGLRCVVSAQIPDAVICSPDCIALPLAEPEKWAEAALDPSWKTEEFHDLYEYDMNQEIRRLEKLYLDPLD